MQDPGLSGRIRKALYGIVDYYVDSLNGANGGASLGLIHCTRESRMPVSATVLDVRGRCCARLAAWSQLVLQEQDLHHPLSSGDALALAQFLIVHADYLGGHVEGANICDQIEESAHDLRSLAEPKVRDWIRLGDCPVIIGEAPCGATVRAYADRIFVRCPRCKTEDTWAWWMSKILPEGTDIAAADTVIAFVSSRTQDPFSHERLRQWATRGYIRRYPKDRRGRTQYSCRAVLAYYEFKEIEAPAES